MMDVKKGFVKEQEDGLDIVELLMMLWSHKWVVAILSVLVALAFFTTTVYFTDDTYTASGILYISNRDESQSQGGNEIQKTDIDTSRLLGSTYIEILQTRAFMEEVSKDIGSRYKWDDVLEMTTISSIGDTELLKISVTADTPTNAHMVANSIVELAPQKLIGIYESGKVEVVDHVHYPQEPDGKKTLIKTLAGLILGFALGVFYALIRHFLDTKVHSSADINRRYGVSILGELSHLMPTKRKRKKSKNLEEGTENILNQDSGFDVVETYKSIRTNIMFSIPKSDKGKIIVVTSSAPGEGKTTTSINMAITFAQTGAKVVLLDCDLRKSRVHRYLQIKRGEGISNVLCGFCDLDQVIHKEVRENLDVLTAGEIPPNPVELLESEEFGKVLTALQEQYDYVFIDTPPMAVVTDAAVTLTKSHGVVVVARQNATTFELLDITMEGIKKSGARILGTVVSGCDEKQKKYGYYRKGKYGYQYTEDSNEEK